MRAFFLHQHFVTHMKCHIKNYLNRGFHYSAIHLI